MAMHVLKPLAAVLLLLTVSCTANQPPLVGSGGYTPYFDWNAHSDALALHWTDIPKTSMTVELWYMVTDPYLYATTLFSYGAYNAKGRHSAGGDIYEQANEFVLFGNNEYLRFMHGTSRFDCKAADVPECNIYANVGNWTHFAFTWTNHGDEDGGMGADTILYINGELVYNHTFADGDDGANSMEPGGVLMLAQEQDSPWGDLEEVQSMTGYIDEFRVWSTVRTSAEIKANYKRSIDMDNNPDASDLNLYWRFDTPDGTAEGSYNIETDLSSAGTCDGLIGDMPTIKNVMQYATDRGFVAPDAPEYMVSSAPVVGGGEVVFPCACSSGSASTTIELPAEDPDGDTVTITIASVPSSGSLTTSDGTTLSAGATVTEGSVVYTQSATFSTSDTFTYTASDGTDSATATVTIVNDDIATADDLTVSVDEDELKPIILGKSSNNNEYLEVVITALPAKGTLYQAAFQANVAAGYDSMIADSSDASLVAITATGTTLTDARGIVLYAPEANEFESSGYSTFSYKYVDTTNADESSEATVTLNVVSVNDGPTGVAVDAEVADGDTSVIVTLTGSDVDNDASTPDAYDPMFAPHFFATIEGFPALGTLYQVSTEDEATAEISSAATPTVTSYVSKILRYSSQYSVCGSDCYSWASDMCTLADEYSGAVDSTMFPDIVDQSWGEGTCSLTKWAAYAFLGAPDFYPGYADTVLGWDLAQENYGDEWIEVMFDTPLYIKDIQVYETYKPGSINKVSSAESYDDDNTVYCNENGAGGQDAVACSTDTEWTTLYSGTAAPAGEAARIFEPNLCPYAYQTQFVRLDLDTSAVPGWNNFDAAMISGSQETPTGLVLPQASLSSGGENRVLYEPLAGIHGDDIDSFTFTLSDCVTSGEASTASISVVTPTEGSTADVAFHTTTVDLDPNTNATVSVDFTDGWDYSSVSTQWPFGTDDLIWTINAVDSTVSGVAADGTKLVAGTSGTLSGGATSMDITVVGDAQLDGKISIWVTTASSTVVVRYVVESNVLTTSEGWQGLDKYIELGLFMPVTGFEVQSTDFWKARSVMALLAVEHFNDRDPSVVGDLAKYTKESCPILMNASIFDTEYTAYGTVKQYTRRYSEDDVHFDAIVGAARSACSTPLATLAGIDEVPQISYWSTSAALNDKGQYPYFLRTIPSDEAVTHGAAQLFASYGYSTVGIVYVADAYGQAYADGFIYNCGEAGIDVVARNFAEGSQTAIDNALESLVEARINVMIVVIFDNDFGYFAYKANELGMFGPGKLMLFADATSSQVFANVDELVAPYTDESFVAKMTGNGRIAAQSCEGSAANPSSNAMYDAWLNVDAAQIERFNEVLPSGFNVSAEIFTAEKYDYDVGCFVYDAVIAHGIAACQAYEGSGYAATGSARKTKLFNVSFTSEASGTVRFDESGNRAKETGYYVLSNVKESGAAEFAGTYSSTTGWDADAFVFSDGSAVPPDPITKPAEKLNQLSDAVKSIGVILFAGSFLVGLIFAIWTMYHFNNRIVRASQPQFLLLIILGCWVSSATIIPLGIDDAGLEYFDSSASDYIDRDNEEEYDLDGVPVHSAFASIDTMCQFMPFLYGVGFAITFSSLFSKIIRVLRIFGLSSRGSGLNKAKVQVRDMALYQIAGIFVEAVICIVWALLDPLHWERETVCVQYDDAGTECLIFQVDEYGHPRESAGRCTSREPWLFLTPILIMHFSMLLFAVVLCYRTRNISTEFQEGKWINMAMVSNLQILVLGIPVLYMVNDQPEVSYVLRCGIIFLNDVGVLCVIFLPKMWAVHMTPSEDEFGGTMTGATTVNGGTGNTTSFRTANTATVMPTEY